MFNRRHQPPPGSGLHQCPLCHDASVVPVHADAEAHVFIAALENDLIDAGDFGPG